MRVATKKAKAARAALASRQLVIRRLIASCRADIRRLEAEFADLAMRESAFRAVMATELPRISRGISAFVGTDRSAADGVLQQSAIDDLMRHLEHGIPEALRESKTALKAFAHLEKLEAAIARCQTGLSRLRQELAALEARASERAKAQGF